MVDVAFTVEGRNVLQGAVCLYASGAWMANLGLEGDQALATGAAVKVAFPDGIQEFNGTVLNSIAYGSRTNVEIVGGKGGLRKPTDAQQYRETTAKVVLSDLARQGGETLSLGGMTSEILDHQFESWAVMNKTVGQGITDVAHALGVDWIILDTGDVWLGTLPWKASTAKYELVNHDTQYGFLELAPGDGAYAIRPGQTVEGLNVTVATYRILGATHRIVLEYQR